ncbi:hypothetical protein [Streptomyces sp. AC495_CC817]|uniref:hypothetical protein n=1 Tax=Streptomyces sp. AC495_CC817 TaxID=2823900 RepID=UPI001C25CBBB|nr:hypothetical protein [Streptomyces sp. AC495_CC817]
MTQFASRTPYDTIRDPEGDALIANGDFCEEEVYGLIPEKFHNEVNPILAAFRARIAMTGEHPYWGDNWDATMDYLDFAMDYLDFAIDFPHKVQDDPDHVDHARRVLSRLANFAKED